MRNFKAAFGMEEIRLYLAIIVVTTTVITINLMHQGTFTSVSWALRDAAFHVGSIMTTTGYAIDDVNQWPRLSQGVLVFLMFCGACAGSTGGGFKISRILLMARGFNRDMAAHLRPDIVKKVHIDGKAVEESVLRSTGTYTFVYMAITILSALLISIDGKDWMTTFTAVVATFNNVGPGLGEVGTVGNYAGFSNFSKLVMSADMLIGRLEIFPILVLFKRNTWKKF
ncbi:MAG: TrkH family potassium uptake protein, partial [Lachnospiraceae bacterium]|nr:TrkH family potassium uptake protein [Lachnospiraceae bacterium]